MDPRDWPFTRILLLWAGLVLVWLPSALLFSPVGVFLPLKPVVLYGLAALALSALVLAATGRWVQGRLG